MYSRDEKSPPKLCDSLKLEGTIAPPQSDMETQLAPAPAPVPSTGSQRGRNSPHRSLVLTDEPAAVAAPAPAAASSGPSKGLVKVVNPLLLKVERIFCGTANRISVSRELATSVEKFVDTSVHVRLSAAYWVINRTNHRLAFAGKTKGTVLAGADGTAPSSAAPPVETRSALAPHASTPRTVSRAEFVTPRSASTSHHVSPTYDFPDSAEDLPRARLPVDIEFLSFDGSSDKKVSNSVMIADLDAESEWSLPVGVDQIRWKTMVYMLFTPTATTSKEFAPELFKDSKYSVALKKIKSELVFGVAIDIGPGKFRRSGVRGLSCWWCFSFL